MKNKKRLIDIIEEEEEEATWLETFADMSMLLLTFFILLYSLSSLDKKVFNTYLMSIKKALGGEIKEVQGVKISLNEEEGILLQEVKLRHQIIEQQSQVFSDFNLYYTQKGIEGVVGAKFDKGKIIIALSGDVLFPPGKVTLTPKGKAVLKKLKDFLIMHCNEKINIIGHTDDIPPSPNSRFKDNWEISAMRALNVLRFLASLGINPERMMATGLADTKPLVPNTSPKNRKRNRRVEIILEREV
jgi:chemotaxis protein MotB